MSESAKSTTDIDDVLSSIRRLVSEAPAPSDAGAGGPFSRPASSQGAVGRLVLTPALRVTDTAAPTETAAPEGDGSARDDDGAALADLPEDAAAIEDGEAEGTAGEAHRGPGRADAQGGEPVEAAPAPVEEDGAEADGTDIGDVAYDDAVAAGIVEETAETREGDGDADRYATVHPDGTPLHDLEMPPEEAADDAADVEEVEVAEAEAPELNASEPTSPAQVHAEDPEPVERPVGGEGWRPEMRLFDWEATGNEAIPANGADHAAPGGFEPDTGDLNWGDGTSNRALLDLAAARGAAASAKRVERGPMPVFSRNVSAFGRVKSVAGPDKDGAALAPSPAAEPEKGDGDTQDTSAAVRAPDLAAEATFPEAARDGDTAEEALTIDDVETVVTQRTAARVSVLMGAGRTGASTQPGDDPDRSSTSVTETAAQEVDLSDLSALDHAALRRIVAEVVREELRGDLGERITRNVRKLVRREIRLLLAVDELD